MTEKLTEKVHIQRYCQSALTEFEDTVLAEKSCILYLDGNLLTKFTCINKEMRELAAGHLLCEGYVCSKEELKSVLVDDEPGNVYAVTELHNRRMCTSEKLQNENHNDSLKLPPRLNIDYPAIVLALKRFQEMSLLFKETGSVHSAALLSSDYCFCYFSEDMGRYNAVEKVIGKAFLDGFDLSRSALLSSSRMPLELIQKIFRAGITAVVSVSAPTLQSIQFAKENNMFLAGMFRENRINIYSNELPV